MSSTPTACVIEHYPALTLLPLFNCETACFQPLPQQV
jgi:hypothetical protein